jgi:putative ABC transport system permease protein
MFKQILKIIWNQRTGNAWIWGEMLLVSVCLWYIVDDLYIKSNLYLSPKGYDIANVYTADLRVLTDENNQYRPQHEYGSTLGEDVLTLVSRIKTYPGVEAVGISNASLPYSYNMNHSSIKHIRSEMNDTLYHFARRFLATPDYIRVFRYATPQGDTETLAGNLAFNRLIISHDVANELYPEGQAAGKLVHWHLADSMEIGSVMKPVRFGDFETYKPTYIIPLSEKAIAEETDESSLQSIQITLRITPAADKDFIQHFRKNMKNRLRYHNFYLLDVRSFADIRTKYIKSSVNDTKMYLSAIFFLLINIFLGVAGTFFFRTQHRLSEIGLRIALGSTQKNLRILLTGEGLTMLLFAFVPAAVICLNLGLKEVINVEIMTFNPVRFLISQSVTLLLMGLMIIIGIWYPSWQASRLNPVDALRNE